MSKYPMVRLEDVCDKATSSIAQKDLKNLEGIYPIYGAGGFIKNVNFYKQDREYIAIVKDGAGIGRAMILPAFSSVIGTMQYILPKDNIITKYLYFAIDSMNLAKYFTGATIPHIYFKDYKNESLPLPPIEHQRSIIKILESIVSLIIKRKQQLSKFDELAKSRFIEMFGDPIRNIKCWQTKRMDEVAPVINYKGNFKQNEIWLLNLDMVESNTGKIIAYNYVTASEVGSSTCTFDTTNVLYSKLRPYLNKVVIPKEIGYATSEMMPLQPVKGILDRYYLAYMLRNKVFVDYISEKVSGAKMPRVTMNDFRDFKVPIPPIELQNQFANFVIEVDKLKFEMEKSLKELEDNFNSLMQRAFKGELF